MVIYLDFSPIGHNVLKTNCEFSAARQCTLPPTPPSRVCSALSLNFIILFSIDLSIFTPVPIYCLLNPLWHSLPWHRLEDCLHCSLSIFSWSGLPIFYFIYILRLTFTRHKIGIFDWNCLNLHSNVGRICTLMVMPPHECILCLPIYTGLLCVFPTMLVTSLNVNIVFQIFFSG